MARGAVVALSHGGGPMPLLGDPGHKELVTSLQNKVPQILKLGTPDAPTAIVLVTAHWSEETPVISNSDKHSLYFDYYNFPPETYKFKYDAPGAPDVAKEVFKAFSKAGLKPKMDAKRGWDHGVFVPMLLVNSKADIPIVQVSVLASEAPEVHFAMGQALSTLRDSNIAIIGSGLASFHNLGLLFSGVTKDPQFNKRNAQWSEAVTTASITENEEERDQQFRRWRSWPGGNEMHPPGGGEHFLPLIVCAGAAGNSKAGYYIDSCMGLATYTYYWT